MTNQDNMSLEVAETGKFHVTGWLPVTFDLNVCKSLSFQLTIQGFSGKKDHNEAINDAKTRLVQDLSTFLASLTKESH